MEASDNIEKMLMPEEELLWSGSPNAIQSMAVVPGLIWLGIFLIVYGAAEMSRLLPDNPYYHQDPQLFGVFWSVLGVMLLFFPIYFYLCARDQVYAVTNKRLLWISRWAKKIVLICEPQNINSISVIQDNTQYGSLHFTLQGTQRLSILLGTEIHFDHVRDVQALTELISSTFRKPISASESPLPWLVDTYQTYRLFLRYLYWPARDQMVSMAIIKSLGIWVILMLLPCTALQNWLSTIFWSLYAIVATHGLVLFLTTLRND